MDAGVGVEADLKLQRKAADLIQELQRSLRKCLWSTADARSQRRVRPALKVKDLEKLIQLLEPFQEWPQLLDPHLEPLLSLVIDAFVDQVLAAGKEERRGSSSPTSPPLLSSSTPTSVISSRSAACRLLYCFCKVRGVKVVSRFFSSDAGLLEPTLKAYERWNACGDANEEHRRPAEQTLSWEERYVIVLWLGHLLFVPFDIASISPESQPTSAASSVVLPSGLLLPAGVPWMAKQLLSIALANLGAAGKERESANVLLVRLSTRADMVRLGMMRSVLQWALSCLSTSSEWSPSIYYRIGLLSYLVDVMQAAGHDNVLEFLPRIFDTASAIVSDDTKFCVDTRSSALARKILIKIYRVAATLELREGSSFPLEDVIDHLLSSLADRDTPVRYAASKAIGVITTKLDLGLAREVVDAILRSLDEDLDRNSDRQSDPPRSECQKTSPAVGPSTFRAVDALRWHGLILTLANLLFHRSPPPDQLSQLLEYIVLALQFEQRSSTGSSVGANVRDAACFGAWALSRRYKTDELQNVHVSDHHRTQTTTSTSRSLLQVLATELVVVACLDPVGNIRRGASAALQELIGRHPDTVAMGIGVVQTVDYHAVALRANAVSEVGVSAAKLHPIYWAAVFGGLLGWRGAGSLDVRSRRVAALGIGALSDVWRAESFGDDGMVGQVVASFAALHPRQVEAKHGLLLALSALLERHVAKRALGSPLDERREVAMLNSAFPALDAVVQDGLSSQSPRAELTIEAACYLACSTAKTIDWVSAELSDTILAKSVEVLEAALLRSNEEILKATTCAAAVVLPLLDQEWRVGLVQRWIRRIYDASSGRMIEQATTTAHLRMLGTACRFCPESSLETADIVKVLLGHTALEIAIEHRVAAIQSLGAGVLESHVDSVIAAALCRSLDDYTVDARGDIGSLARLEAIDAAGVVFRTLPSRSMPQADEIERSLLSRLARLSVEKLDKVRVRAVHRLRSHRWLVGLLAVEDTNQASSYGYFYSMLGLLHHPELSWLHPALIQGYVTTAGSGSETIIRASRRALVTFGERSSKSGAVSLSSLLGQVATVLERSPHEDRTAIPALEVLAFMLEMGALPDSPFKDENVSKQTLSQPVKHEPSPLLSTVSASHARSRKLLKLEAVVRVYSAMAWQGSKRKDALDRLARMLLHPFARIRWLAAEVLYTHLSMETTPADIAIPLLAELDWSWSVSRLKKGVEKIESDLQS